MKCFTHIQREEPMMIYGAIEAGGIKFVCAVGT